MNILAMIKPAIMVLNKGEELSNAPTWKNRQSAFNALFGLLGAAVLIARTLGLDLHLSDSDLASIATTVVVIYGAVNPYLTTATSAKVGMSPTASSGDTRQQTMAGAGAHVEPGADKPPTGYTGAKFPDLPGEN